MAFMGIFLFGWLAFLFAMIVLLTIVFVFIPCLIIFIINLAKGIRNKWPKRHLIPTIFTGIFLSIIITFLLGLLFLVLIIRSGSSDAGSSSAQAAIALHYYLQLINY